MAGFLFVEATGPTTGEDALCSRRTAAFRVEAHGATTLALAMASGESAVPGERRDRDELGRTDLTPIKSKRLVRADSKADGTGVADDDEMLTADDH